MFKRKQKRSQWMEGLLEAEDTIKEYGIDAGYAMYYNEIARDDSCTDEFSSGYYDYLMYRKNILG